MFERRISCVISGSFSRSLDEINRAHRDISESGIFVRSPERSSLYLPSKTKQWPSGYPLVNERELHEYQAKIKQSLEITESDFWLLVGGYMGESVGFEAMVAFILDIPMYTDREILPDCIDGSTAELLVSQMVVMPVNEVIKLWTNIPKHQSELWWPNQAVTNFERQRLSRRLSAGLHSRK